MRKAEFLDTLSSRLTGEVSASELESTIRYYDEYISEAVGRGKTEEQVLEELGSPLLIARTIIDTSDGQAGNSGKTQHYSGQVNEEDPGMKIHRMDLSSWKAKLMMGAVIAVVLVLIFTILKILIPVAVPLIVIWLIVTMFRKGGRG